MIAAFKQLYTPAGRRMANTIVKWLEGEIPYPWQHERDLENEYPLVRDPPRILRVAEKRERQKDEELKALSARWNEEVAEIETRRLEEIDEINRALREGAERGEQKMVRWQKCHPRRVQKATPRVNRSTVRSSTPAPLDFSTSAPRSTPRASRFIPISALEFVILSASGPGPPKENAVNSGGTGYHSQIDRL